MPAEPFSRRECQVGPEYGDVDAMLDSLTDRIRRLRRSLFLRSRLFWLCTHAAIVASSSANSNARHASRESKARPAHFTDTVKQTSTISSDTRVEGRPDVLTRYRQGRK